MSGRSAQKAAQASGSAQFSGPLSLTQEEVAAVNAYQNWSDQVSGTAYHDLINSYLRGKTPASELGDDVMKLIPVLDRAIAGSAINRATTLYRGMRFDKRTSPADLVGMTIHDKGFLSTSIDKSIAVDFSGAKEFGVVLKIKVPAGHSGLAVFKVKTGSDFVGEREVLLARGRTLKIKSAKIVKQGWIEAVAELTP